MDKLSFSHEADFSNSHFKSIPVSTEINSKNSKESIMPASKGSQDNNIPSSEKLVTYAKNAMENSSMNYQAQNNTNANKT